MLIRNQRHWLRHIAFLLLVAGLVACGGGDGERAPEQQGGAADGAADAAVALFASKGCAECHGTEGEGTERPNSEIAGTRMIIQQFTTRVRNGKGSAMPGYGPDQITDDEIRILYDWLRSGQ